MAPHERMLLLVRQSDVHGIAAFDGTTQAVRPHQARHHAGGRPPHRGPPPRPAARLPLHSAGLSGGWWAKRAKPSSDWITRWGRLNTSNGVFFPRCAQAVFLCRLYSSWLLPRRRDTAPRGKGSEMWPSTSLSERILPSEAKLRSSPRTLCLSAWHAPPHHTLLRGAMIHRPPSTASSTRLPPRLSFYQPINSVVLAPWCSTQLLKPMMDPSTLKLTPTG